MLYKVKDDHNGAVMIGDRAYHRSQIIRDDGASPKLTKTIEKLLQLEESPISLVEEPKENDTPPVPAPEASPVREKGGK
jgi:hypothetical protein